MPLHRGLLVSCKRNFEQSASSEIHFALVSQFKFEGSEIRVKSTGSSGLITVKVPITADVIEIMEKLVELEIENSYFLHCLKIKPVEMVTKAENQNYVDPIKDQIDKILSYLNPEDTYKIQVTKRHAAVPSIDIISNLAPLIENTVKLDNPDKIINIEILADIIGIAVVNPNLIYSTRLAFTIEKEKEVTNWFLD